MGLRRLTALTSALVTLLLAGAAGQVAEFDFYPEFRQWNFWEVTSSPETRLERYRQRLIEEGVAEEEITRRLTLLRTRRPELEKDFWNRFFTVDKPAFNTEPNAFLTTVVEGRSPGRALDVAMGEGRNSLYLAKLGWDVTGFDQADKAVALASERANLLGVKIRAVVSADTEFDFGREQWELILYSWAPGATFGRVTDALKPGGVVVVESASEWAPRNGLLQAFDSLRVVHYEDRILPSDYFPDREMRVVRLLAEKEPLAEQPRVRRRREVLDV